MASLEAAERAASAAESEGQSGSTCGSRMVQGSTDSSAAVAGARSWLEAMQRRLHQAEPRAAHEAKFVAASSMSGPRDLG